MKTYYLLVIITLFRCSSNEIKVENITSLDTTTNVREYPLSKSYNHDSIYRVYIEDINYSKLDSDTSLVMFMYGNINNYNFDLQKEEYIYWYNNRNKMNNLLYGIFSTQEIRDSILKKVNFNMEMFVSDAKKECDEDVNLYDDSLSMSCDFINSIK